MSALLWIPLVVSLPLWSSAAPVGVNHPLEPPLWLLLLQCFRVRLAESTVAGLPCRCFTTGPFATTLRVQRSCSCDSHRDRVFTGATTPHSPQPQPNCWLLVLIKCKKNTKAQPTYTRQSLKISEN